MTVTSASNITVVLPGACPTAVGGVQTNVVYTTEFVSTDRYRLKRGTVRIADYLTEGDVFSYVAPSTASLGKLHLDVRVNVKPLTEAWKQWHLQTDVILRNTQRA